MKDPRYHWEEVYQTKDSTKVGWFQSKPEKSLSCIHKIDLPKDVRIIDVGGGDSLLVDHLLDEGYKGLHVLDISNGALKNAQNRLASKSSQVFWHAQDILQGLDPSLKFDLWHDRAAFHFFTEEKDQIRYREIVSASLNKGGFFIIGTFSPKGPNTCSGLPICQYSIAALSHFFSKSFRLFEGFNYDHITPSGSIQNYSMAILRRR
ncbi:Methyltransferase domain-containing protein [Algoriphagus faecimaris]|uniref:Methyltransferase domain-containing protein n=1 Tax=Algoriphagus faecimaris TaxID=686796 RepID=A0A1G6TVT6_9BACT|nr:class I SAM-dependent methyltransferase [Algoriphagus faecimaris]SDD33169.1 Methyltransferase domain-containing protein [Algoriphagus faecimaris]